MKINPQHLEKLHSSKELLVTSGVIILCLILSATFPVDNTFQSISRNIFFLVILPILYIKLILKNDLASWGWNLKNRQQGLILGALALLTASVIFYLLIRLAGFSSHYLVSPLVQTNFWFFLLYELVFLNIFFFTQEFFFKGFILFAFNRLGYWSVAIQAGLYLAILISTQNLSWQTSPFIFISIIGGFLSYKTRSFLYSYIFGLLFIIVLDAYIIHLIK